MFTHRLFSCCVTLSDNIGNWWYLNVTVAFCNRPNGSDRVSICDIPLFFLFIKFVLRLTELFVALSVSSFLFDSLSVASLLADWG